MSTVTFNGSSLYKEPKSVNAGILDLSQNFRDWTGSLKQADGEQKAIFNISGQTKQTDLGTLSALKSSFFTLVLSGWGGADGTYTVKMTNISAELVNYKIDGVFAIEYSLSLEEV